MNPTPKREIVDFDPETGIYRATYDYPSEPPSQAVPLALMEVTESDVTDLDPLYDESVDPDALDDTFRPKPSGVRREVQVTFTYHDYTVTVKSYGRILIRASSTPRERFPD